jgi:hypothetical protein
MGGVPAGARAHLAVHAPCFCEMVLERGSVFDANSFTSGSFADCASRLKAATS